jgi:ubiquinone/menaquinone biosynthesis C-methylase UbiE
MVKRFDRSLGFNKAVDAYTVGLDVWVPWLRRAKNYYNDVVNGNARYLPFRDKSFEVCTAFEIIEHLTKLDAYKFLKELDRVTKRQIIITSPVMEIIQPPSEYSEKRFPKASVSLAP